MARTTLHAIAATTAPLGLAAQLLLAAGGPALAQQQRLNGITPAMAGAVLNAKAATRTQLIQIRPEALRSLSNRLRAGQPVAANELDAYKEFCTEQVSQANVRETNQERRGSQQASNSQHVDRSNRWDTSFNRDGRYANSAKGEVSLFGCRGKVRRCFSPHNNGPNRGPNSYPHRVNGFRYRLVRLIMASKNQEQQHPQERLDRPIVDQLLQSEPNDLNLAECARLRIRYQNFPGAREIQRDLDLILEKWQLDEASLWAKTRPLHSHGQVYQIRQTEEQQDWS